MHRLEAGRNDKEQRKWDQLREQFKTCQHPWSGAYAPIRTVTYEERAKGDRDQ